MIADVPLTDFDPSSIFYDYSWRSFIALNWPALGGADNRGLPDRARPFGDATGPRVWTTWKSRYEIFQPGGTEPAAWQSFAGANPCGQGFGNEITTLSSFSPFADFNQATFSLERLANPLVAQNRTYSRFEIKVNKEEFDSIVSKKWYLASELPTSSNPTPFKDGSIEVKAAWKILTGNDNAAARSRYFVIEGAQVLDVATGACRPQDIALVGFHIVAKTPDRPQWIWSSFEHVDNVPGTTTEPATPAGIPHSFNDPAQPQTLGPRSQTISTANPPSPDPDPLQVVRMQPILPLVMATNRAYWALPEIKGTVWENYMLVMTQWPTAPEPESPSNAGAPFPDANSALSNTTMETFFQKNGTSCMDCHQVSNDEGRDFVMFVSFDAFRPDAAAPASTFASKLTANQQTNPLAKDAMIENLIRFFEANQE